MPPMTGFAFALVRLYTMPRAVTVAPPSSLTVPPSVAENERTDVLVGDPTVGGDVERCTISV